MYPSKTSSIVFQVIAEQSLPRNRKRGVARSLPSPSPLKSTVLAWLAPAVRTLHWLQFLWTCTILAGEQPGEWSRIHQWSFRPSASTVFSHATAFLPLSARYVGVQRGTSLVTWLERDPDVRRPLSVKVGTCHGKSHAADFMRVF